MRAAVIAVFLLAPLAPARAQGQTTEPPAKQAAASEKTDPPGPSDDKAGTERKRISQVFLTRRKYWSASGGFAPNAKVHPPTLYFTKDFQTHCPRVEITDMQDTADFAVTIDESGLLEPNQPTFQVSVYSRRAGLLYTGGTWLVKNAVKDACNAIVGN